MIFFRKYKKLHSDEKKIVDLLVSGNTNFINSLKKQVEPPFFLGVYRKRIPREYKLSIIFDGNLETFFSMGENINTEIDDLVIKDFRITEPIRVKAEICEGILISIIAYTEKPVKWPHHLKVNDWGYVNNNIVSFNIKERISYDLLDFKILNPYKQFDINKCKCKWLKELVTSAPDGGKGFIPAEKISLTKIKEFESKIKAEIPLDLKEFLNCTNGANFWGTKIFKINEFYLLDEREFNEKLLVFSTTVDGSTFVLVLNKIDRKNKYCPVDLFYHHSGERIRIGDSLKTSLNFIRDEIFKVNK